MQPATKDQEGVQGPVLFWGKGGRRKGEGGDERRVAREESQGKGPDACFAPKQIYKAPSPRKLTS